jgi:hypothetical protein
MRRIALGLLLSIFLTGSFLSACSDSGSSTPTGELTLRLTDLPLELTKVDSVCIAFNRITIHHVEEGEISFDYAPPEEQVSDETHCPDIGGPVRPVKLNALEGSLSVALAESFQVPAGRITWIRLHFIPEASTVIYGDNMLPYPINCTSCEPTDDNIGRGFKLVQSFHVPENGNLALMIDIDLRRSLAFQPNNEEFRLNPTARVEIDESLGGIAGAVAESLIVDPGALYDGTNLDTGCAVYIYDNGDGPEDYFDDPQETVITTVSVRYDIATGLYRYVTSTLPGGTESVPVLYSAALTCDLDDATENEDLTFVGPKDDIEVVGGLTTEVNFTEGDLPQL